MMLGEKSCVYQDVDTHWHEIVISPADLSYSDQTASDTAADHILQREKLTFLAVVKLLQDNVLVNVFDDAVGIEASP